MTLAEAIAKLNDMRLHLKQDFIWHTRIPLLIMRANTDPRVETTDEFCDAVEKLNLRTLAPELQKLWDSWGLSNGETFGSAGAPSRRFDAGDQGGVPPAGAEDPS